MGSDAHKRVFLSSTWSDLQEHRDSLKRAVYEAVDRRGQDFGIFGPPGSGKSTAVLAILQNALDAATVSKPHEELRFFSTPLRVSVADYLTSTICAGPSVSIACRNYGRPSQPELNRWQNLPSLDVRRQHEIDIIDLGRAGEIRCRRIDVARFREVFIQLVRRQLQSLNKLTALLLRCFQQKSPRDEVVTVERAWFLSHGVGRPPRALAWVPATGLQC